jgi:enoyl-[acyl-carrier-protein] reductase (NADH)
MIAAYARSHDVNETEAGRALAANTSIGRMVTAGEIGDVVAFPASPRSASITGDAIAVGGGSRGAIHY